VTEAIRSARPDDAAALARVHVAAWRAAYRGILPEGVLEGLSVAEFERTWQGLLADATRTNLVICPQPAGPPAGFVAFRVQRDAGAAEIIGLYVDPVHWREGLGRRLMEAALARLAGAGRVALWVMRDNAGARAFYERAGLRASGAQREAERYGVRFTEVEYVVCCLRPRGVACPIP
jgi:ribosomal protein S18 acetylase RimI-like enzyme